MGIASEFNDKIIHGTTEERGETTDGYIFDAVTILAGVEELKGLKAADAVKGAEAATEIAEEAEATEAVAEAVPEAAAETVPEVAEGAVKAPVTEPAFEAPKIYSNNKGQLTNGTYTLDAKGMEIHETGSATSGKSQFLYGVNSEKTTLDAATYADANNLWVGNKAKVPVADGIVGVTGSGQPTNYINVYRTNTGFVHASPANPPK